MGLHEHGIDEVVVEFGMLPFDRPCRVDQIHPIPHQWQDPANGRRTNGHEPTEEPCPPGPSGQTASHEPVLEHHATRHPDDCSDTDAEQEGRDRDPLVVGTGCGKPSGEIPLRLGVGLAVFGPRADGKRLRRWV